MVMGELSTRVDVAVIGAGPGGYTAAIRAAQLGLDVVLIEKNKVGGCCTNVGCIPSKALIHLANIKYESEMAAENGLQIVASKIDFEKMQKWVRGNVAKLRDGIEKLCKLNGVEIIRGTAFFESSNMLSVQTEAGLRGIDFRHAIIATGASTKTLDGLSFDHKKIIDSDDIFSLDELPKKMVVVGGGYISVEMACLFAKLGTKVTVIYRGKRLLKNMDAEISDVLTKKMKELGCEIFFESNVVNVVGNSATVKTPNGDKEMEFDKLLITVGREPNYDGLGLEKTKVKIVDGLIVVDDTMRTNDENIFAIGDVVAGPQLAHKAFKQGKVAAEIIAGMKSAFDSKIIPSVVFSEPEIASVGMLETEVRNCKVGRMPLASSGRAKAIDRTDGFVKIIADENGIIRGAHTIGFGAEGIIAEATLAMEMGATLEDLALTIHAHPTMSESLQEAAEEALGKAIHLYKGKR